MPRSRQTDSRSMPIAAEQRSERAGKGNEAVRVSGVSPPLRYRCRSVCMSVRPSPVWAAEGTALKAAWVSGDPLRRNAKSNVGATLLADAVTRASRQGPLIAAQEISTRESVPR